VPAITYTEFESLLRKADECAVAAKLATDPEVRKANEKLAAEYFQKVEEVAASRLCWA